jgi:hypothetical protein
MSFRRFVNSYVIENLDKFPKEEDIPTAIMANNEENMIFKE